MSQEPTNNNNDTNDDLNPQHAVEENLPAESSLTPSPQGASQAPLSRDAMRAKIFGAKPKSEVVEDFFGCTVELRQPTLEVALSKREQSETDRIYTMLTDYAFVPGTDDLLFSMEDVDALRGLPFGAEFQRVVDAVNKLLGINPKEVEAAIQGAEKST